MVVLNFYGKISTINISKKLGLYLSNLPSEEFNNWQDSLSKELCLAQNVNRIYQENSGTNYPSNIKNLYKTVFPIRPVPDTFKKEHYDELAGNMICLTFNYSYEDMPVGGWESNCFDGRLCEDDCAEKIIKLINFLSSPYTNKIALFPTPIPRCTYSSNYDIVTPYHLFHGVETSTEYIYALQQWGELFDNFLESKNDYLLFDYLINSIYKDSEYNEYHLMKNYSLCQLFLENNAESELDDKLCQFVRHLFNSQSDQKACTTLLRKLRNKIAHGDFMAFEKLVEEYAVRFMDGRFAFDYSELSRKNWVIQNVCCLLDDIIRQLIYLMFYKKSNLIKLKKA